MHTRQRQRESSSSYDSLTATATVTTPVAVWVPWSLGPISIDIAQHTMMHVQCL